MKKNCIQVIQVIQIFVNIPGEQIMGMTDIVIFHFHVYVVQPCSDIVIEDQFHIMSESGHVVCTV
jgi:hypothetical protein